MTPLLVISSLLFCFQVPGVKAGDWCDSYYDDDDVYHFGWSCPDKCCGYDENQYCCETEAEGESAVGAVVGSLITLALIGGFIALIVCLCKAGCPLNSRYRGAVLSRPVPTVAATTTVVSSTMAQTQPAPAYTVPMAPQAPAYQAQPNAYYNPPQQQYPQPAPPYQPPQPQYQPPQPQYQPPQPQYKQSPPPYQPPEQTVSPPPQPAPPVAHAHHLQTAASEAAESENHDYEQLRPPPFAPRNEKAPLD